MGFIVALATILIRIFFFTSFDCVKSKYHCDRPLLTDAALHARVEVCHNLKETMLFPRCANNNESKGISPMLPKTPTMLRASRHKQKWVTRCDTIKKPNHQIKLDFQNCLGVGLDDHSMTVPQSHQVVAALRNRGDPLIVHNSVGWQGRFRTMEAVLRPRKCPIRHALSL